VIAAHKAMPGASCAMRLRIMESRSASGLWLRG
jgi:hypothetical protein